MSRFRQDPPEVRRQRNTARYRRERERFLTAHPFCAWCRKQGLTVGAEELDHIEPCWKAPKRFWDRSNWQGLCRECHELKTLDEFYERNPKDPVVLELEEFTRELIP